MGSSSPALSNMLFLVLLSAVAMAFASPIPEEGMEAPEAVAYIHDPTGDVTVYDSPAALPYVHDATGDVAVPYVHEEPVLAPVAVAAPVVAAYSHYPNTYGAYPYIVAGAHVVAAYSHYPNTYGAYPYLADGDVAVAPKVEVKAAVVPLRRSRRGTQTLKKLNELLTLVREIHSHLI